MSKLIPLTQGYSAIVDDEDYDWLMAMGCWFAMRYKNTSYAARKKNTNGKRTNIRMHIVIMGSTKGKEIDHINGNGLDNRKSNLRFCTRSQNMMNRAKTKGASSRFKGVCWAKDRSKWRVKIKKMDKIYYLGQFENETIAAKAYDKLAKKIYGKFARLNFPESTND